MNENVERERWRGSFCAVFIAFLLFSASSAEAVSKKILENGLTILAKESPPQNLVAIDLKIEAGSSLEDEYLGSGISHLVEHMVFKGTATRSPGDIEKEIKSYGGLINGSTSQDLTNFHITIPSEYLPQALSILKDMLANASFDERELEKEKEVILKEIRMNNDEPERRVMRRLNETAYSRHTYKYPPIGYEATFKRLRREDAVKYYNRMYVPNRIVIAVVGRIGEDEAISKIENEFKEFRLPDYSIIGLSPAESLQISERDTEETSAISLSYLAMGFHSTSLLDNDLFAMDVLAILLGRGDNSRLNSALFKKKGLVHSISSWNYTPREPGLFVIAAILDNEKTASAKAAIIEEIEKIKRGEIEDEEIETARRMVLGDFIFSQETISGQADELSSNYIFTGDVDFSSRYIEGIKAVSKDDVKKAANKYLKKENLTIVTLVPVSAAKAETKTGEAGAVVTDTITKEELPNGLTILARKQTKTPTVSISVAMLGGLGVEGKETNGISNLVSTMLLKGTKARDEDKIKGVIESLGGSINSFSGYNSFGLTVNILKEDLPIGLEILEDVLANSTFPQEQIEKEKGLILAAIKQEDDDIFQRGFNALRAELFGDSPYGFRQIGEAETIKSLKREDLLNFYNHYCAPNNMVISISGDIEPEYVIKEVKMTFGDLKRGAEVIEQGIGSRLDKPRSHELEMEKDQSLVLMGFETVCVADNDRYALDLLCSIMSGSSGRLFATLRDKRSLAYVLGCAQRLALTRGYLAFYVASTRDKIDDIRQALTDEINLLKEKEVSEEELNLAKRELITGYRLTLQTNAFFSSNTALDELYGLGYDNIYKYEAAVEKVTADDVKRVAVKYLDFNACAEVVITSK